MQGWEWIPPYWADLTDNTSALFVIGSSSSPSAVIGALEPYKGKVYQTTLDAEADAEG